MAFLIVHVRFENICGVRRGEEFYFETDPTYGTGKRMNRYTLLLAACIALGAMLAGCPGRFGDLVSSDAQTARYDDVGIKTGIASALLKKDSSKANDINVHCFNGHVFLVGEADAAFRAAALAAARQAKGVVHVTTHWFPTGTASTLHDAAIEGEIHAVLLGNAQARVNLDVWGGHVVLTGLVDNQDDTNRILAGIKKIYRVKSVTSYIALTRSS
jgi:osmotically-inducible protein OsmY